MRGALPFRNIDIHYFKIAQLLAKRRKIPALESGQAGFQLSLQEKEYGVLGDNIVFAA